EGRTAWRIRVEISRMQAKSAHGSDTATLSQVIPQKLLHKCNKRGVFAHHPSIYRRQVDDFMRVQAIETAERVYAREADFPKTSGEDLHSRHECKFIRPVE